MPASVEVGQRWRFEHGGVEFDIVVSELRLNGTVVHGELIESNIAGRKGDMVICPTAAVETGEPVFEDPLGRTFFETQEANGDVRLNIAPGQQVCDFCLAATPSWAYPCGEVVLVGNPNFDASDDPWAACDRCHYLIEAGNVERMIKRMVNAQQQIPLAQEFMLPPVDVQMEVVGANLRAFLAGRTGPARPWHV